MSVVAVISTKGGAGKSTVASQLAIAAVMEDRSVVVFDCDASQLSLDIWDKGVRKRGKAPTIQRSSTHTLVADIAAAKKKHDLIIIDVGAGGGDDVRDIATLAEHVLIPVRPATFDISAMRNTVDLLRKSADNTEPEELAYKNALGKAAVVINCAPRKQSAKWRADFDDALADCGAGGLPIVGVLADRAAYSASILRGRGVAEEQADEGAVREIHDLYRGVVELENERALKLKKMRRRP
jgi:chromosome partitioning protein